MYSNYDEERDDELYHYGKTGMKWGKHKAKPVGTSLKSSKIVGGTR